MKNKLQKSMKKMRSLKISALWLTIMIVLTSCKGDEAKIVTVDFIYNNETSTDLSIKYYFRDLENNLTIAEAESLTQSTEAQVVDRTAIINADSLILSTDIGQIIFTKNNLENPDNPLNRENYVYEKVRERYDRFTFTFE